MKTKNFPARKLLRQMNANRDRNEPYTDKEIDKLNSARNIRTKKYRGSNR